MWRTALIAATIAVGMLPPAARAAIPPDRTTTLTAATPTYSWDGPQASGHHVYWTAPLAFDPQKCTKEPATYCDATLVRLDAAPGTTASLLVTLSDFSSPTADFDVYIYTSDAAGNPGEAAPQVGCCEPAGTDENVSLDNAEPGHYLVYVPYWLVHDASFKGKITGADIVAPATPPSTTPPPAAPPQQPPAAAPKPLPLSLPSRASFRGRTLRLKVTARAEITDLQLRLSRRGKVLGQSRRGTVSKGVLRTNLRLRSAARPGRYTLTAAGTIDERRSTITRSIRLSAGRRR